MRANQSPIVSASEEHAADAIVDPDRRLDSEPPDSDFPDDIAHWVTVYGELLRFKESLIANLEAAATELTGDAQHEIQKTDLVALTAERDRFARRLAFWRSRRDDLSLRLDERRTA